MRGTNKILMLMALMFSIVFITFGQLDARGGGHRGGGNRQGAVYHGGGNYYRGGYYHGNQGRYYNGGRVWRGGYYNNNNPWVIYPVNRVAPVVVEEEVPADQEEVPADDMESNGS